MPLRQEAPARPSGGATLWCTIYQVVAKHVTNNCHLLQKFMSTPQQLFCDFCKSVGHDEHHYQSYELMMERTPMYQMQEETLPLNQGIGGACGGYQGHRRGRGGGRLGRGRGQFIYCNCEMPRHYAWKCMNQTHPSCQYCTQFGHTIEEFPVLIAKM